MGIWIKAMFFLTEEVDKATISNPQFNVEEWCIGDAEIFEKAARLIRSELANKLSGRCHVCGTYPGQLHLDMCSVGNGIHYPK